MMPARWLGHGALSAWTLALALAPAAGGGNDVGPPASSLAQLRQASKSPRAPY